MYLKTILKITVNRSLILKISDEKYSFIVISLFVYIGTITNLFSIKFFANRLKPNKCRKAPEFIVKVTVGKEEGKKKQTGRFSRDIYNFNLLHQ